MSTTLRRHRSERFRALTGWWVLLASLGALQACSLITIKGAGTPLTPRELSTRVLTREYAERYQQTVAHAADEIIANNGDPAIQVAALQWKIEVASASRRAATQIAPMMSLLDSWAFAAQMREFLTTGAGRELFGAQQDIARAPVIQLEQDIIATARAVTTTDDFKAYQQFVDTYVRDTPLSSEHYVRMPVVDRWAAQTGTQANLISAVGTVPDVLSDLGDRMRILGDQVPTEVSWRAQLALRKSGYGSDDWRLAMGRMNSSLDDIGKLANASPELLRDTVRDLRSIMMSSADRLDQSSVQMMRSVSAERLALSEIVRQERIDIMADVDVQRRALTMDAERIASQATDSALRQLRGTIRELAIYSIAGLIVVLGLPFVAGFLAGRARGRRAG